MREEMILNCYWVNEHHSPQRGHTCLDTYQTAQEQSFPFKMELQYDIGHEIDKTLQGWYPKYLTKYWHWLPTQSYQGIVVQHGSAQVALVRVVEMPLSSLSLGIFITGWHITIHLRVTKIKGARVWKHLVHIRSAVVPATFSRSLLYDSIGKC